MRHVKRAFYTIILYIPSEVDNMLAGWRKRSFNQLITLEMQFALERRICTLTEDVDGLH